ncbi:MAG: hypothetical protein HOV83_24035 [Catenulispora sp.]|nr:hypothetical protein [Catenulispora sp.]
MTTKTTIKLSAAFTDTTLPKDRLDPVLPDAGALLLVDFMHPALSAPIAGVPAHAATIENLAKTQAAAAGASMDTVTVGRANFATTADGLMERTTKGGLHVAHKQGASGYDPGNAYWQITLPAALKTYILANTVASGATGGHKFYASVWQRFTRARVGGIGNNRTHSFEFNSDQGGPSSNYLGFFGGDDPSPTSAPSRAANVDAVGPNLVNLEIPGAWNGIKPPAANNMWGGLLLNGPGADMYNFTADLRRQHPSKVVYRVYLEDLTVSGRTYAQVDALDFQQYTKDVMTPGGRFYGDTWTDPTTLG